MSDDFFDDGLEWQDWLYLGPLSEGLAREKRERDRLFRENEDDEDDYWYMISRR